MENVVVVVVVTMRDGSLGSGMRFDWENLRDPRLLIASSERKVCSILVNRTRCAESGNKLTISVEKRSLKSCAVLLAFNSVVASCSQFRDCPGIVITRNKQAPVLAGQERTLVNGRSSSVIRSNLDDV